MLVDDHAVIRDALASMLDLEPDFQVIGQAGNATAALATHAALTPEIILLDVRMPGMDGFQVLESLRQQSPHARILMLATSALAHELRRARDLGARGYLPKQVTRDQLAAAVRVVHAGGECWEHARALPQPVLNALSARELEVLDCIRLGFTNADTGKALCISEHTVKHHVKAVLAKLQSSDRAEAVARGFELGLLT